MDEDLSDKESLLARIHQLENERDELRKDIEQLCIQQAGPSYLVVATKMHFQRTAGLEQEIENLKKKLAACTRDNVNLQEELSEAYRIKGQLADLHGAEVAKNVEAEKQLKFFQGCVAAAFAERDHSIMEAEKAKEKEELMSNKFCDIEKRLEEQTADCSEQKKLNDKLKSDLAMQEEKIEAFKKVIDKFYEIRQQSPEGCESTSWDRKCACLLHDPAEWWSFNDASTSKYISALEEELERTRKSVDNLQNRLRMGLEIENHLKRKVGELEKKKILTNKMIKHEIAELHHYHSQHRVLIMNLLNEGKASIKSVIDAIEENCRQIDATRLQRHKSSNADPQLVSKNSGPDSSEFVAVRGNDYSEALAHALQDKVSTLLLLSQQEERHLLDRNVNAALERKIEELHRNLLQVTNEKVKALMEFAQLKQDYHQLKERIGQGRNRENLPAEIGDRKVVTHERDGRLKSLLKKTYLSRWVANVDFRGREAASGLNVEGNLSGKRFDSMEFARMKIEIATLQESMGSMEHLTTTVHRLRLSLSKVKELVTSGSTTFASLSETVNDIINEAKLVKTALSSSLPISWSADEDVEFNGQSVRNEPGHAYGEPSHEKIDSVYAAGLEMVELLILAAQILKDNMNKNGSQPKQQ
ncbi:uncharacterized protein [Pyrus communis]|uniref:uncharacterized protein isoform X1 n=1 Tax=Pyrus communis TaxID=23211 RepID=UPI0035C1C49F